MRTKGENKPSIHLTTTEISNIWSAHLKITMELRLYEYFYECVDNLEIKQIIEKLMTHSHQNLTELKKLFTQDDLTLPIGFTEKDVNKNAQKAFSDSFIMNFCNDLTLLSLSTYPSALSDSTRKDVRSFFQNCIDFTMNIQNEITDFMLVNGLYSKPPQVAMQKGVEFVESKKYLSNLLSGHRSLNAAEISNLYRIIHRAQFSKMVFVTFGRMAKSQKVKKYFSKGRDSIENVGRTLQGILETENIPISSSGDFTFYEVEDSPFSDKLMIYFVNLCIAMFCFIMLGQALNSSLRTDLQVKLTTISAGFRKYYGEGLLLTIEENWLEEPPQAIDTKIK